MMRAAWRLVLPLLVILPAPAGAAQPGCVRSALRIVLDVGHTPQAWGATSARGRHEYDFNLALARATEKSLQREGFAKASILLSQGVGHAQLAKRTARANGAKADVFLSFHHDYVQDKYLKTWTVDGQQHKYADDFSGYSLFVSRENPQFAASLALAREIGAQLQAQGLRFTRHHAEPIAGEGRELLDDRVGVYGFDRLVVLRTSAAPAVLMEAGIIANRKEEEEVLTPGFRERFAAAVTAALAAYCSGAPVDAAPKGGVPKGSVSKGGASKGSAPAPVEPAAAQAIPAR